MSWWIRSLDLQQHGRDCQHHARISDNMAAVYRRAISGTIFTGNIFNIVLI